MPRTHVDEIGPENVMSMQWTLAIDGEEEVGEGSLWNDDAGTEAYSDKREPIKAKGHLTPLTHAGSREKLTNQNNES